MTTLPARLWWRIEDAWLIASIRWRIRLQLWKRYFADALDGAAHVMGRVL